MLRYDVKIMLHIMASTMNLLERYVTEYTFFLQIPSNFYDNAEFNSVFVLFPKRNENYLLPPVTIEPTTFVFTIAAVPLYHEDIKKIKLHTMTLCVTQIELIRLYNKIIVFAISANVVKRIY